MTGLSTKDAAKPKKKANPWVENIESLVVAVVLALIIRVFVVEAFVIPTGSMASSLYGNHFEMRCPNCGYRYALGFNPYSSIDPSRVRCPNCGTPDPHIPNYTPGRPLPGGRSGGDRILVNKVLYRFFSPTRWDPFVFVNPTVSVNDEKPYKTTYIKRLVGLPGDVLEILRGDIIVDGKVQRKPPGAQSRLWQHVYDINYVWKDRAKRPPWKTTGRSWSLDGKRLVVDCPSSSFSWVAYAGLDGSGTVRDHYGYDQEAPGEFSGPAGSHVVTDLRLSFDFRGTASGRLVLSLACDADDDQATIDFAAGTATLSRSSATLASVKLADAGIGTLADGAKHHISFQRLDYLLTLAIDGAVAVEYDLWSDADYRKLVKVAQEYDRLLGEGRTPDASEALGGHVRSGVMIGAAGATLELTELAIDRDVYYTFKSQKFGEQRERHYAGPWKIPQDCYFAMGDNSPESLDSRYWPEKGFESWVPADHLIGRGLVIWWHPRRIRLIR